MHWQLGPSFEHLFYYYRLVTVYHVNILSCLITTLQSSVQNLVGVGELQSVVTVL